MNWNEIMKRELERAGAQTVVESVPECRRASAESILELEREIADQIGENEAMCARSRSYAAAMPV